MRKRDTSNVSAWPPTMVVCVGAVVLRGEHVLLVRQAEGHSLAGQWSIPWGFVDPGEFPHEAALREIYEESGINAEIEGLLGGLVAHRRLEPALAVSEEDVEAVCKIQ